ncbi:hypothetical protein D3C71_1873040 [compost metagenome]
MIIQPPQSLRVDVEQSDIGAESGRHPGGVRADGSAADNDDLCRPRARNPAKHYSFAAGGLLQQTGSDLNRHSPGHFTHRYQQRQASIIKLSRLVGDGGHTAVDQRLRQLGRGGQMKVGEEN